MAFRSLCSRASPGLAKASFARCISRINYLQTTSALTERLMLCLVTTSDWIVARTSQMQLQMPCLVILRENPTKDLWGLTLSSLALLYSTLSSFALLRLSPSSRTLRLSLFEFHSFEPHVSEPRPHVSEPHLPGSTLLSLTFWALSSS